jgi:hypothetical protein
MVQVASHVYWKSATKELLPDRGSEVASIAPLYISLRWLPPRDRPYGFVESVPTSMPASMN